MSIVIDHAKECERCSQYCHIGLALASRVYDSLLLEFNYFTRMLGFFICRISFLAHYLSKTCTCGSEANKESLI